MKELTHLSLFSGIGGLDLAAEWAGFTSVGQCEWADYPSAILEKHWPDVPRWRDIRTLTKESFYERTGLRTVNLISGGFPCQPFSTAGKRRGKEDDRYLWPEMLRVISELRPTWVVSENVAGLVSMAEPQSLVKVESRSINRLPDSDHYESVSLRQTQMLLPQIIRDIEQLGYEVQIFIVPACAVDAPHRRDRICIVAYTDPNGRAWSGAVLEKRCNANEESSSLTKSGELLNAARPDRRTAQPGLGGVADGLSYWLDEPAGVPRVATGIKKRVDRLKCLGNAVVPQQFYPIFKAIADIERRKTDV